MLMSPVRAKILEICANWTEINEIAKQVDKSRTTVLNHLTILMKAGAMEVMTISSERTRKKLYKTIPFKVKIGAIGAKKENTQKAESPANSQ